MPAVGSPTKTASVYSSRSWTRNWAAENVLRPMSDEEAAGAFELGRADEAQHQRPVERAVAPAVEAEVQHHAIHRAGVHEGAEPSGEGLDGLLRPVADLVELHVGRPAVRQVLEPQGLARVAAEPDRRPGAVHPPHVHPAGLGRPAHVGVGRHHRRRARGVKHGQAPDAVLLQEQRRTAGVVDRAGSRAGSPASPGGTARSTGRSSRCRARSAPAPPGRPGRWSAARSEPPWRPSMPACVPARTPDEETVLEEVELHRVGAEPDLGIPGGGEVGVPVSHPSHDAGELDDHLVPGEGRQLRSSRAIALSNCSRRMV